MAEKASRRMRIHCRFEGKGPRCFAHPGGPGFSARYLRNLGGLDAAWEIGFVDPRGTGASESPADPGAYALDDYVEDLAGVIGTGNPPILLGHSHGGVVAQHFAARYPERLRGLVLADTAARFSGEILADMERHIDSRKSEPWYEDAKAAMDLEQAGEFRDASELGKLVNRELPFYFYRYNERERAYVEWLSEERCNPDALRLFNQTEFQTMDLRPELSGIKAKTVIITGEEDFICPPVAAREMHERIRGSELTIIPECGHFTFVERPEAFCNAILEVFR